MRVSNRSAFSTAVLLNMCAIEVSYLANSLHIYIFGFDKQIKNNVNTNMGKTPGYKANSIAVIVSFCILSNLVSILQQLATVVLMLFRIV